MKANPSEQTHFRQSLIKPDGRDLTLYSRHPIATNLVATTPSKEPITGEPHLRWHPLREEWVAYATHRQNRTFLPPKEYNPLAPTTSPEFPTELPAGDYDIAVFTNLFASLTQTATQAPELSVPTRPGKGHCEVVVFTQDAESCLAALPLSQIELLLEVWADRHREIAKKPDIRYIMPFENRGVEVGVTLHHPHGQIYAYPFIPPAQKNLLHSQGVYFQKHGHTLLANLIQNELAEKSRILIEGPMSVGFIPIFARYPYETWIVPKRAVTGLHDMNWAERQDLARTLKTVLMKFDALWGRPFPYLMILNTAPVDGEDHPEWHFHITLSPAYRSRDKLKFLAGTELGAGMFVNDSLPEEKAAELQKVEVSIE